MVAFVATLAIVLATRALPRARARLRALGRPPAWYFLGGLGGAALVLVSAAAAPEVGVALLTVALVCGSTGGSLPVDAAGLGPAGRRPITLPRVAGVLLAIAATALSALGARGDPDVLLLALALGGGLRDVAAGGGQRAARARDRRAVGGLAGQRRGRVRGARRRRARDAGDLVARDRCRATRCSTPAACSARSWSSSARRRCRRWACCGSASRWWRARWPGRWSST